jgi:hypothetical protein
MGQTFIKNHMDDKYIEEYQLELRDELSLTRYPHQLTSVWLKMVKDYPHIYSMEDYFEACKTAKLLVF